MDAVPLLNEIVPFTDYIETDYTYPKAYDIVKIKFTRNPQLNANMTIFVSWNTPITSEEFTVESTVQEFEKSIILSSVITGEKLYIRVVNEALTNGFVSVSVENSFYDTEDVDEVINEVDETVDDSIEIDLEYSEDAVVDITNEININLDGVLGDIDGALSDNAFEVSSSIMTLSDDVGIEINAAGEVVSTAINDNAGIIGTALNLVTDTITGYIGGALSNIGTITGYINDSITSGLSNVYATIEELVNIGWAVLLGNIFDAITNLGQNIVDSALDAFFTKE